MSGSKLKQLAKQAKLTPTVVAAKAGISTPTLYKVYNDGPVSDQVKAAVVIAIKTLRRQLIASLEASDSVAV